MDEKYRRSPRVSFIEKAAAAGWQAYFAQLARALFVLLKLQLFPSPPLPSPVSLSERAFDFSPK